MSTHHFLYQLAIERCQHNLAQLCAIVHLDDDKKDNIDKADQTVLRLIEALNRDIEIIKSLPVQWFEQ